MSDIASATSIASSNLKSEVGKKYRAIFQGKYYKINRRSRLLSFPRVTCDFQTKFLQHHFFGLLRELLNSDSSESAIRGFGNVYLTKRTSSSQNHANALVISRHFKKIKYIVFKLVLCIFRHICNMEGKSFSRWCVFKNFCLPIARFRQLWKISRYLTLIF